MRINVFRNKTGVIHGRDPKRIGCDKAGVLKIGKTEVNIIPKEDSIMPMLFQGCTGDYDAIFTARSGETYNLGKVAVRGGWIQSPPKTTVELMELRYRADAAEEKIEELSNIFDTNSLNFIIN